jgi:hypothetical protein
MRAIKILIAACTVLLTFNVVAAAEPNKNTLHKEIKKQVQYPAFAKSNQVDGLVMVKYEVLPNGSIKVLAINQSHSEFGAYVRQQLEGITINDPNEEGMHYAKFTFRFEPR